MREAVVGIAAGLAAEIARWLQFLVWVVQVVVTFNLLLRKAQEGDVGAAHEGVVATLQETAIVELPDRINDASTPAVASILSATSSAESADTVGTNSTAVVALAPVHDVGDDHQPPRSRACSTDIVVAQTSSTRERALSHCDEVIACRKDSEQSPVLVDYDLVEAVTGLQGLKAALAASFVSDTLPESFRRGYVVDLDQHWITVHVKFTRSHVGNTLSLIVFDTLEINYQLYHEVGLLRSSSAECDAEPRSPKTVVPKSTPLVWDATVDVATLCDMRGIQYDISFLAPICDMRRLTWEEEEEIRIAKSTASGSRSTIYYDRNGNPFRKIIVQPILQAERDGTCRSRALAALGWLLRMDEKTLAWYVSRRELFHVELKALRRRGAGGKKAALQDDPESEPIFGSLMASGKRDKFGRDVHMKVCHGDTFLYNSNLDKGCSTTTRTRCLPDSNSKIVELPVDAAEDSLRLRRKAELARIKEVLQDAGEDDGSPTSSCVQRWRQIEDHEARWQFLEETCFFGHNIGFKKIRKKYSREEVLPKVEKCLSSEPASEACAAVASYCEGDNLGFGETKYIRKYMVSNSYVTHEADPMFHEPIENFLGFLNQDEEECAIVPFYVLPFPGCFVDLRLEDYVQGSNDIVDLEGDPNEHRKQKVSDFLIPSGNMFLNDPFAYNRARANVSLPVKQPA
eukprot:TRINITY_DN14189_c2_g7_i1.p1 TRINITY_DN14189_c2_g7~~TRINITY_DN14189_c2_g7_i1.p1  ORF type:complete len:743 (+),score=122.00 TRINITY_DN14189_c2_g7_i1:175-2229(+)